MLLSPTEAKAVLAYLQHHSGTGLDGQKGCADLSGAHLEGAKTNNETDLRGTLLRGASYNTKPFQIRDNQLGYVTLWATGFDPKVAVAICDDC